MNVSNKKIRVLVTGDGGQLAFELKRSVPDGVEVGFFSAEQLDITNDVDVLREVKRFRPNWVINAAALTNVDLAEDEPEKTALVNTQGAINLANVAKQSNARLVQVSTDYVFSGGSNEPYAVEDNAGPLSVYGRTKNDADKHVLSILGADVFVVRTSWVYSKHGHNFVKTIVGLCNKLDKLSVISDQLGTPTCASTLAAMIWQGIAQNISGIWHFTDAGIASWYDFAVAIQDIAFDLDLIGNKIPILPIISTEYPQKAARPKYGILDKSKTWRELNVPAKHWHHVLENMMQELV
jgi:dTDP-4-dehydrorhamnose reductase